MSLLVTASNGLMAAANRFDRSATNMVRDIGAGNDILTDLVDEIESRNAFHASVNVVRAADDMMGRVLDIKA
jgi:hypothetical protein